MRVDPWGLDAIIITNKNSVGIEGVATAGHTSAIYQDRNGDWYYTYWGNKATAVIKIPNQYMGSLDSFNTGLNNFLEAWNFTNITSNYIDATYIMEDFTQSLNEAFRDVREASSNEFSNGELFSLDDGSLVFQGHNSPYNVLYRNCFDETYDSLSKSTLANGINVGIYMKNLGFNGGMIPNNAIAKFGEVFMNSSFAYAGSYYALLNYATLYVQNSPWAQKWEKANYANAVIGW